MEKTGGEIVVEVLKSEGVTHIFGYPGGAALPLYDALSTSDITHILTRHEQGAAHAADGYARATGKVGVCISTSGPGATNLVTGIATANMDSIPMVCITCQVAASLLGKDSFQEADVVGITAPITKFNHMVQSVEELGTVLKQAFHIARSGRPGPVVVDIPKDLFGATCDFTLPETEEDLHLNGYHVQAEGNTQDIDAVVAALATAKRPVLFMGGGVIAAGAEKAMLQVATKTNIPVVTSLMAISALPTDLPNYLGMVGMHGTYAANMAVTEADLLIGLGVRFDDRVTSVISKFVPHGKIAHFDIDPSELGKNVPTEWTVQGDLAWSLPIFAEKAQVGNITPWQEQIKNWQETHPLPQAPEPTEEEALISPPAVFELLNKIMPKDSILVTDVGQHQMWAAQYAERMLPRTFLTSGGLGTMGYGLPAAVGAAIGCPGKEVWLISGDGSIMMNCQELATLAEQQLPVKILVLNNRGLGMVRQWQRMFFGKRCFGSKHEIDTNFATLAKAMGVEGQRVDNIHDLNIALQAAAKIAKGPMLIDARILEEANVYPMVAPGAAIYEMIEC
ncbi:MAG: biosynthetic-type acetolactate synthase large subunit [Peptococcaceae bacterium]|nr:biosynthetic-type acetolactate synthase large subunit [Peptococcaceae bacterium]